VPHGGQEVSLLYAVFANMTISIEGRCRAKESIVMQRMHDRNMFLGGGVENCRRDYWKGIVHVNNIWSTALDKGTQLTEALLVPNYLAEYYKRIVNVCVSSLV
jgi:hypothetical protein